MSTRGNLTRRTSRRIAKKEGREKTSEENWNTARTKMKVITSNKPDRDKNPTGLRISPTDGAIKSDQK